MSAASPSDKELIHPLARLIIVVFPLIKPKTYSLPHINLIGKIRRGKQGKISEPPEQDFFRGKREGRL